MWTDDQRKEHKPRVGRYPSDVSDAEWAFIEPMIPPPRTGGRKRDTNMREVFNAIRYIDRTGCTSCVNYNGLRGDKASRHRAIIPMPLEREAAGCIALIDVNAYGHHERTASAM